MQIFKSIIALWRIASWLRSEKRNMEADIDGYLTEERAKEWRLQAEKIFKALDTGNVYNTPSWVHWLFRQTSVDNRVGEFGGWLLKSRKIQTDDKALNQPLYRMH